MLFLQKFHLNMIASILRIIQSFLHSSAKKGESIAVLGYGERGNQVGRSKGIHLIFENKAQKVPPRKGKASRFRGTDREAARWGGQKGFI